LANLSFNFLCLNPPYDSEIGSIANKRMEFLFLEHTYRWLVEGGVLLMVVPQGQLHSSIPLLAENFIDLRVFRLTDPESERFDQVALFGSAKRMHGRDYSRNRAALHEMVWRRDMPTLRGNETPYRVPASTPTRLVYRGLPLDQIEGLIVHSSAWKQVEALLLPKEEMAGGRPITPLHAGHVGLLCTAGLLNGVFGQGQERHIARWRSVKSVTVFEVKEKGYTEVHKREQFTNELALVYEDGRTVVLGDKKREDEDAERTFADGRLEYRRNSGKTDTKISVHVDRYVGQGEDAHLISLFGGDSEVGAITAAIHEKHTFTVMFPDGKEKVVGFGPDAICYRGSVNLQGRKQALRHLSNEH
jgi:hypothetical protein